MFKGGRMLRAAAHPLRPFVPVMRSTADIFLSHAVHREVMVAN
jgi:hypothetical protein